jgi:hypothetical protein
MIFHVRKPDYIACKTRLSKMHAKTPICFNFFNFHLVSSKFSMNIEHIIHTKRMFFVFGIATFWQENDVTNLAPKN